MNILPKKRWHVRTKDNIARVLRDEKKAADEEQEKIRRKTLAEQEARLNILRVKRGDHLIKFEGAEESASTKPVEHVNLFKLEEEGLKSADGTNVEHEKEKKAETEQFEKNLGLLTYLGGSVVESKGTVPWYLERRENKKPSSKESNATDRAERDRLRIKYQDPLNAMSKHVDDLKRKRDDGAPSSTSAVVNKRPPPPSTSSSSSRLEQLRAERLKRESNERSKASAYLTRVFTGSDPAPDTPEPAPVEIDDRKRRYNSQYNPDVAKQNVPQDLPWRKR